jgi:lipopolysaccharide biosynthesis regulator YciM
MPVSATEIAEIYARLNDEDKAFEWLNRAVDDRDGQDVIDLKCDPVYKNLREDPRYVALLRRMGLPE